VHCHGDTKDNENDKDHMWQQWFFPHMQLPAWNENAKPVIVHCNVGPIGFLRMLVVWCSGKRWWRGKVLVKPTIEPATMPFAHPL
jgi:hypothetical protein